MVSVHELKQALGSTAEGMSDEEIARKIRPHDEAAVSYASSPSHEIIKGLHKKVEEGDIFVPEEGQRTTLCSNESPFRCPSSDITGEQDEALSYLAAVLVEAYLEQRKYATTHPTN